MPTRRNPVYDVEAVNPRKRERILDADRSGNNLTDGYTRIGQASRTGNMPTNGGTIEWPPYREEF